MSGVRSEVVGEGAEPPMEPSLIRLNHCHKDIFCFSVPDHCPSCGLRLMGSSLQEAPVSLPSPFNNGHKTSCCLLVAPAHNNVNRWAGICRFINTDTKMTLYVCVCSTDVSGSLMGCQIFTQVSPTPKVENGSRSIWSTFTGHYFIQVFVTVGVVYNYTQEGVRRDTSGWQRCISVPLVRPDMFHLLAQWDQYLESFSEAALWDPAWQK